MQKCEGEIQKITVWFLRSRLLPETFGSLPFALGDQWFLLRTMVDQRGFILGHERTHMAFTVSIVSRSVFCQCGWESVKICQAIGDQLIIASTQSHGKCCNMTHDLADHKRLTYHRF